MGARGGGLITKVFRFLGLETTSPNSLSCSSLRGGVRWDQSTVPGFRSSLASFEAAPLDSLKAPLAHEVFP